MLSEAEDLNDLGDQAADALNAFASALGGEEVSSGDDVNAYDLCGGIGISGATTTWDTKWTTLLRFNAYLYLVLAILMFFTLFATCVKGFLCCTCAAMTCGGCAHLALIIVTGVFRFSSEGKLCAENDSLVIPDGSTFKEHGDKIKALFISQCVFLFFVGFCMACSFQCGLMSNGLSMATAATSMRRRRAPEDTFSK